jgi:hypothetical protein
MRINRKGPTNQGVVSDFHRLGVIAFLLVCIVGLLLFKGCQQYLRYQDVTRHEHEVTLENQAQMESARRSLIEAGCVADDRRPSGVRCDR